MSTYIGVLWKDFISTPLIVGTFLPSSSFLLPSSYSRFRSQRWDGTFIFSNIHWSDPLLCMRHCVRHSGDEEVTQSWRPLSGAQCSWRTTGTPSCVVCVEPLGAGGAQPDLTSQLLIGHPQSTSGRATKSALCQIWEFEALIQ